MKRNRGVVLIIMMVYSAVVAGVGTIVLFPVPEWSNKTTDEYKHPTDTTK